MKLPMLTEKVEVVELVVLNLTDTQLAVMMHEETVIEATFYIIFLRNLKYLTEVQREVVVLGVNSPGLGTKKVMTELSEQKFPVVSVAMKFRVFPLVLITVLVGVAVTIWN